jgi:hypothetical protein
MVLNFRGLVQDGWLTMSEVCILSSQDNWSFWKTNFGTLNINMDFPENN